jgi:PKD repeat protein
MKKCTILICLIALILAGPIGFAQQTKKVLPKKGLIEPIDTRVDNMGYWMKKAESGVIPFNPQVTIPPAIFKGTQIMAKGVKTENSPDIPVTNLTNVTESENSVFIDPNNADYILNSNNSTQNPVGSLYGANYFQSADNGQTWGGSYQGAGGSNSGDPATAISHTGRQYVGFIDNNDGQSVAWSNDGNSWTAAVAATQNGDLLDKNHMWIDNSLTSPYEGNIYVAYTDFGATGYPIEITRSANDGLTYSTPIGISAAINAGSHNQGVNIQTGPNGEVYVAWTVYDGWPTDETAIGFTKSTDGGISYQTASRIISNIKGIRTTGVSKNHRVNSFPVMAVDISGGAYNGNLYIVWTNIGTPGTNTGTNKSVYIIRSSNGGTTWSTPVRVNQGPNVDGKEAYFPWISCDPETGVLSVVFYDDRNVTSTECEVFSAYSTDAGNTWTDFQVSDVAFTPAAIPGLAGGYMGDYLGITSKGGKVYPCWTDNRGGLTMTYVSPYQLGLNAGFSANNTTVCTASAVTFLSTSTGPPTSWTWSFPGGTPSSYVGQTPPPITYSTPGTYDVSLTVSDGTTTDTETKTGYITVKNLIANFTGTPTTVVIGNSVTFTDNSSCSPTAWNWSFPGGTPSSYIGQNPPAITYNTIGTYDVVLTITKPGGTDTKTRTGYITVTPPIFNMTNGTITTCTGDFYDSGGPAGAYQNNENYTMTFYPSTPGAMIRFVFTSFSTEPGYDYLRIYNGTSAAATLIGTYNGTTGPGTVTANNAAGALTFNFTSDVSVTPAGWSATISCQSTTVPPVADFSASSLTPPINTTVTFTDLSSNLPTSWAWSFSPNTIVYMGGTTATSQNPQVQFNTVGAYTVSLTATNINGSDIETKTNYINTTPCSPCASTSNDASMEWISNVTFNTINNTSAGGTGYQDFTAISTNVTPGSTYSLSITCGQTGTWTEHAWAFIDWNKDCDFTDTGESYDLGQVSAPGTMTLSVTVPAAALSGPTRMRASLKYNSDPTSCETFSYGQVEDYTVNVQGTSKNLTLKVYLEGLYDGSGTMRQARDAAGPHFGSGIADQVTVELHNATNYGTLVNSFPNVNLSTTGDIVMNGITTIPSGSYYITIRHRNSIETTTAAPVSFAGATITYDFSTAASQAHGNNLLNMNGVFVIYDGDVNQDGLVNSSDILLIESAANGMATGYIATDINGDGLVDLIDMVPVDFNADHSITTSHP